MLSDTLRHIDRLIEQRPAAGDILKTYRDLLERMADTESTETVSDIRADQAAVKLKEGFSLFSRDDLPLDLQAAALRLSMCLEHLSVQGRPDRDGLERALDTAGTDPGWARDLFKAVLREDGEALRIAAATAGLDPRVLRFLAMVALSPSVHALRAAVSDQAGGGAWERGYCPVCGSEPNMACLTRTGARYLHCGLCGDEWRYPRMTCPFCENDDHRTLGYFEAEEEEGFRVYFCRKCDRYIKTVDQRVFEEPAPLDLEYMATLHLDFAAAEKGFS